MKWQQGSCYKNILRATIIDSNSVSEPIRDSLSAPAPGSPGLRGEARVHRLLRWALAHKVKTFVVLLLVAVLLEASTIPYFSIARLKTENPRVTALMRQRMDEAQREGKPLTISQRWVSLSHIPRQAIDAIIVAEDGTFYSHGGVDWFEVKESMAKNVEERRAARGASTITQQLAKNLYLSTSKDPIRKAKELVITLLLEHMLSKDRILEIYVNVIEWGRGVFGIEAAALTYFGTSVSHLTLDESLRLAAVIPSPLRHRPDSDTPYIMRRKHIVLDRMTARNMVNIPTTAETTSSALTRQLEPTAADAGSLQSTDTTDVVEDDSDGL
jgi:monofunctional biosynthetic peptidoglycan transglycosylase